jgi:predicted nucleotidyltransferase
MSDPWRVAAEIAGDFRRTFGDRLESVVLYGSVPRREAVPGLSDVNLLVLLDDVEVRDLAAAGGLARRWVEAGNCAPLLFGWEELRRSADVFAIELADMRDRREVLAGRDPIPGLEIRSASLRLQLERELRGRWTQLREGMMMAAGRPAEVGDLLLRALPTFACHCRAVLRLVDRDLPVETEDVIRAAGNVVGADPTAMVEAWAWRRAGGAPPVGLDHPVVAGFGAFVKRVIEWVDATQGA